MSYSYCYIAGIEEQIQIVDEIMRIAAVSFLKTPSIHPDLSADLP